LPLRHGSKENYKYGVNGIEKDDELNGKGNNYDTYFRKYDTHIGRWFSPDPKEKKHPSSTPYSL
jgi:hypothetical protein